LKKQAKWLRSDLPEHYRFRQFERRYREVFRPNGAGTCEKTALLVSGAHTSIEVELAFIKALEQAGFATNVLILDRQYLAPYY